MRWTRAPAIRSGITPIRQNKGFHIGSRGVSMYGEWLYFMTPDAHLICLNAKDGTVRWNVAVADSQRGYWTTMSPLIVRNHVLVGVSGDFDNLTGFLKSVDPETGKTQWRWDSTPPSGTPNATTGGMTWMTGTYDPESDTVFWGTGNPTPVLNGEVRPGDNPDTCSIVALDPNTGKKKWAFQPSPHDTHDWDAVEIPVLVDADFHGAAAQDADAGIAQRLLLRAGPAQRREPAHHAVRPGQLVEGARPKRAADSRIRPRIPLPMDASSRPTKAASPTIARPASTRRPACSS